MVPFILINIVVSATVVVLILFLWDSRTPAEETGEATTEPLVTSAVVAGGGTGEAVSTQSSQTDAGDSPTIHVVEQGDNLSSISVLYDVPIADIMAANGLSNQDFLFIGQELTIPIGGLPTEAPPPTATATPDVIPTPRATEPPAVGEANVEIIEVVGVGTLDEEAVRITNSGTRQISLQDWELSDEDGNVYLFGQVTLFGNPEAFILVRTGTGQDNPTNFYWDLGEPIWESGEVVTLTDAEGTVRVTYTIP
jgi:LysM repeat protein